MNPACLCFLWVLCGCGFTVPTGLPLPAPLPAPLPCAGELKHGHFHGDAPESELEGVAGCFVPLAGNPQLGDPREPLGVTLNILAVHSMSESESRNRGDR